MGLHFGLGRLPKNKLHIFRNSLWLDQRALEIRSRRKDVEVASLRIRSPFTLSKLLYVALCDVRNLNHVRETFSELVEPGVAQEKDY
jgi:hypothetical protein